MDMKGLKVTDDNVAWLLGEFKLIGITLSLLVRRKKRAVGLFGRLIKVNVQTLLFNHHLGFRDVGVNKRSMSQKDLRFKRDERFWIFHP